MTVKLAVNNRFFTYNIFILVLDEIKIAQRLFYFIFFFMK